MPAKIKLGISTCLLGEKVRYDGGHKLDPFLRDTLGQYVEYVPVCPEVECGMPTPREALRLVGDPANPRLLTVRTGNDYTYQMRSWGTKRLQELEKEDLCGFVFKSKSPSSGMERIKVYSDRGVPTKNGVGIWARMFMERFPLLPVEDDGRLNDPSLRGNFIERIFVFKRWRETVAESRTLGALMEFHTRHKLLIMSHSVQIYRELGQLVAEGETSSRRTVCIVSGTAVQSFKTENHDQEKCQCARSSAGLFQEIAFQLRKAGTPGDYRSLRLGTSSADRSGNLVQPLREKIRSDVSGKTILSQAPSAGTEPEKPCLTENQAAPGNQAFSRAD